MEGNGGGGGGEGGRASSLVLSCLAKLLIAPFTRAVLVFFFLFLRVAFWGFFFFREWGAFSRDIMMGRGEGEYIRSVPRLCILGVLRGTVGDA